MARRLIPHVLALLLASGVAQAQGADPTRPAIISDPGAVASGGAAQAPSATGLQSIIQRRNGRPAALINGTVVELGGKVGETRLVKIGEDHVVLRGVSGTETLRLTPGVEKRAARKEKK